MHQPPQNVARMKKEHRLSQHAKVIWLYGLSGSGKTTLASALEKKLCEEGFVCAALDGDLIRSGLNQDLGFSDRDRAENIRRVAEVSKLFLQNDIIVINAFITPLKAFRDLARKIIGADNLIEVYLQCSYETCANRDVKGLYAKAKKGEVEQFTGKDSTFEPPQNSHLTINTETMSFENSLETLYKLILPKIHGKLPS